MGNCQANKATDVADAYEEGDGSSPRSLPFDVAVAESSIPSTIENDEFSIPIKIFTPTQAATKRRRKQQQHRPKIRAVVFFIHGGIFSMGDMHSHPTISHALAQLGLVVVTASFRNGDDAPFESHVTMRDLMDVVNHCRETYNHLPFGLVGSSSGGFFAIHLSQTLTSKKVSFCVTISPVADPYKRASYLRASISGSAQSLERYNAVHTPETSKFILEKQLSFWKSDDVMFEASESVKTSSRTDKMDVVPTLLIIGSADKNVPFDVTNQVQGWATRTIVIGGKGHELCDEVDVNGGEGYSSYLTDIERFLDYFLKKEKKELY